MIKELEDGKFDEFKNKISGIKRARFSVKRNRQDDLLGFIMLMSCIVMAARLLTLINESEALVIVAAVITLVAAAVAIGFFIAYMIADRKKYYCYFFSGDSGVTCISVIGETATVFFGGTAYRIEGENFYTLDDRGFCEWFDGECTGLYSALQCERKDFELLDVKEKKGKNEYTAAVYNGETDRHDFTIKDGQIKEIISVQPYKTDAVDSKTGMAKIKNRVYIKRDYTEDFEFTMPEFVKSAFEKAGAELPVISD